MEFFFPAVRGVQGGKTFYVATVPFRMLKRLMSVDIGDVLDRSQRNVDPGRAKAVAKYLCENKDGFVLPSLTGIVEDESLQFEEYVMGTNTGKLALSMDATIKLFDGQHRATGIMQALRDNPLLSVNTITIQLFVHMSLQERQQAFSDINANAKPVSASLNLAYNQRDEGLNRIASEIRKVEAWAGQIDFERNIVGKNSDMLFSYRHVVQASRLLLGITAKDLPNAMDLSNVGHWWNQIAPSVGWNIAEKIAATKNDKACIEIREKAANSVAFTAAGLLTLGRVGNICRQKERNNVPHWKVVEALQRSVCWDKSDELWQGNLVDEQGRMVATSSAQIAAAQAIMERIDGYTSAM